MVHTWRLPGLILVMALAIAAPVTTAHATTRPPGQVRPAAAQDESKPQKVTRIPPDTQISFSFGLKRDDAAAEAALKAVSDPSSDQYRRFPDKATISSKYGATPQTVQSLTRLLGKYRLTVSPDATGVFATVRGTAADFRRFFGTPIVQGALPLRHAGVALVRSPQPMAGNAPPAALRSFMARFKQRTDGLVPDFSFADVSYTYSPIQLSGVVPTGYLTEPETAENKGTPSGCLSEQHPELSKQTYSYNEILHPYGIDSLPNGSDVGGATRLAIMAEGSGFSDNSVTESKDCFGLPGTTLERVPVPGLNSPLPEGDEGDLDVQVAQAVLPAGSTVTVVESPSLSAVDHLAWATLFGLQNQPDVASSSYGSCEPELGNPYEQSLVQSVVLRVALSGTSVFAAAGDDGSSDCVGQDPQQKQLAVDYPGSSPYVTSVGGSRLVVNSDNTRADEVVWNDMKELPADESLKSQGGGGGGGTSTLYPQPWWQADAGTQSKNRAVPDLAAHASGVPGWPVAWDQGFTKVSGTSAATPLVASSFAILAASERLAGRPPLGPVQPWLYQLHEQQPQAFYDIVSGSNDLYRRGCCSARKGYDEASGLGAPNFPEIASHIPAPGDPS